MNVKKISAVLLAGLMTAALLAGCGGDKGGPGGEPGKPGAQAQAPAPPQRSAGGVEFKFGDKQGKVYVLKAPKNGDIDLRGDIAFMQDAIYIHGEEEKDGKDQNYLLRIPMKGETLSAPEILGGSKGIDEIATNGKVVIAKPDEDYGSGKLVIYDGTKFTVSASEKQWPGNTVGIGGSDEFLAIAGIANTVRLATLSGDKMETKDLTELPGTRGYVPIYADKDEFYIAAAGPDEEHTLLVLDRTGKEIRHINGWEDDKFGSWAVTQNYIVMFGKSEYDEKLDEDDVCNFRVFDRASGKEIGDAKVANFDPGQAVLLSGNSLIAYGDDDTFYIIDL